MTVHQAPNLNQPLTAFPEPGVYDGPHMITLLCATPGAEIHYTVDGSTFVSQPVFPGVRLIRDFENNKMYLITGSERALLIDAGMSTGDLRSYVEAFIGDLPLDVCITHGHPDHIAAMGQFQGDCAVYMHHADLPLAQRFQEHLHYEIDLDNIQHIDEGFTFDLGDRQLTAYHIPGHSKGCLALLDETNGILISGDAIGSNGPTIVDALWLQMSQDGIDEYLSALQVFRAKVAGKVKAICGGHGALYLEGEAYLDNLQEAAQKLVDQGVDVLVPSPRPAGAWKTVCGDRLTDPNWASINVNRDTCLTAPPDRIASLSNLQVKEAAMYWDAGHCKLYDINPYAEVYQFRDHIYGIYTESLDGMGDPWIYLFDENGNCIWTEFDRDDLIPFQEYEIVGVPDGYMFDLCSGYSRIDDAAMKYAITRKSVLAII